MPTSLVLTFIGHDKPGLVNAISETIAAGGGNWQESRLARLSGEFAGIVLINAPNPNIPALTAALKALEATGLRITVEPTTPLTPEPEPPPLTLNLVGHDRPGLVRDVTQALIAVGANIEEFSSFIESAPFTGETMFRATARLHLPANTTTEDVRKTLERLADEIMVDLTTNPADSP
jgi:glycine cleavage system regulatory protein